MSLCEKLSVFLALLGLIATSTDAFRLARRHKCKPLEIPTCRKLGYNQTRSLDDMYLSMPARELQPYIKLIDDTKCSSDALFFLCTIYSPVCFEAYAPKVMPCRSVCERVKEGCSPLVKMAGYSWPAELDCSALPEYSTGVCIRPSAIVSGRGKQAKEKTEPAKQCPACKPRRQLKRYKQFKRASYVIEAEVKSRVTSARGATKLTVNINRVYKQGKVKITRGPKRLISPTRCVCPVVEFDKSLIIFGHEDKHRKKLLFDDRSIIVMVTGQMNQKIRKWARKYEKRNLIQKSKKKENK